MSSALEINGKMLHPIKDAVAVVSYSRDYITRLARERKILAAHIGRQWFVDIDSLKLYAEAAALELEVRKKLLSEERISERAISELAASHSAVHTNIARSLHLRAAAVASLALCFGLLSGVTVTHMVTNPESVVSELSVVVSNYQLAQTSGARQEVALSTFEESSAGDLMPEVGAYTADFSQVVQHLPDTKAGFLLLPDAVSSLGATDIQAVFSDTVAVQEREDGQHTVVLVDTEGNQVGAPVPFLVVPVTGDLR